MNTSAKDLFARAHELDGKAREAFLKEACGNDAELRLEVERLLVQAEKADSFFAHDSEGATMIEDDPACTESEGDRVGPYILRQKIGEGGFGVVWMAEQTEPISRMVALKVVKAGMDTKQVLARFEAERQALAMMDHPNIAKVLDAGATEGGRPYFAMELVKGVPITEFCQDQKFGPRRRLALFKDVCSAVNHAHQKGIIHRDLKPSNVMVTLHGDQPVVKVIDFGIAKATQQKLTDKTLFTRFEQFLGTPVYMSPEQAAMSGLDIDTRSDIYSLGVLLYELLAGQPPFDPKTLLSAGYDEMRRIIKEEEPPKPSTRLTQSQASANKKTLHRIAPSALRGELDWIVMKAIDKDRARRYETANAFAADIERFLTNEPVQAAAPSVVYKVRKFARRNKAAFSVAATIATVLVGATVVSTWQAVRATKAQEESEAARQEAEAISTFLTEVFQSPNPGNEEGEREITVAETLEQALEKLEAEFDEYPERRAKLESTIAQTYNGLGKHPEAIDLQRKVVAFYKETHQPGDERSSQAMATLAIYFMYNGQYLEAVARAEERLQICRREFGPENPETLDAILHLLTRRTNAVESGQMERQEDFVTLARELVALSRKVHGPESKETLGAMHQLAHGYEGEESHRLHEEVVARLRKVLGLSEAETLGAMGCLATSLVERGQTAEAVKLSQERFDALVEKHGEDHPNALDAMSRLVDRLRADGQREEALSLTERLVPLNERRRGPRHPQTVASMDTLADLYAGEGLHEKALKLRETGLSISLEERGEAHPDTFVRLSNLAGSYSQLGRHEEALAIWKPLVKARQEYLRHQDRDTREAQNTLQSMNELARSYFLLNQTDEALLTIADVLEFSRRYKLDHDKTFGFLRYFLDEGAVSNDPRVIERFSELATQYSKEPGIHELLAKSLYDGGHYGDAVTPLWKLLELRPGSTHQPYAQVMLVTALKQIGRQAEANAVIREWWLTMPNPVDEKAPKVLATVVPGNSEWRWLHPLDGVDPAKSNTDFHQTFFTQSYDDTAWSVGTDREGETGGFGYGDAWFDGVHIGTPRTKALGKSAYFRHRFTTTESHRNLELRCQRDDGIIVYLNGKEVARDNMTAGDESYLLAAIGQSDRYEQMDYRIPFGDITLEPGEHVLAISLHNTENPSSDLRIAGIRLVELDANSLDETAQAGWLQAKADYDVTQLREAAHRAANRHAFAEAATHFEKFMHSKAADVDSLAMQTYAVALALAEQHAQLESIAKSMIDRFVSSNDPFDLDRSAKVVFTLLPPSPGRDSLRERALEMIERCVGLPGIETNTWFAYMAATRGLAAHRINNTAEVEAWMTKAFGASANADLKVLCLAIRALSRFQNNRVTEAQADLSEARRLYDNLPIRPHKNSQARHWRDNMIAHLVLKEAMETIEGHSNGLVELKPEN